MLYHHGYLQKELRLHIFSVGHIEKVVVLANQNQVHCDNQYKQLYGINIKIRINNRKIQK